MNGAPVLFSKRRRRSIIIHKWRNSVNTAANDSHGRNHQQLDSVFQTLNSVTHFSLQRLSDRNLEKDFRTQTTPSTWKATEVFFKNESTYQDFLFQHTVVLKILTSNTMFELHLQLQPKTLCCFFLCASMWWEFWGAHSLPDLWTKAWQYCNQRQSESSHRKSTILAFRFHRKAN